MINNSRNGGESVAVVSPRQGKESKLGVGVLTVVRGSLSQWKGNMA
jgi:hypothetical protein